MILNKILNFLKISFVVNIIFLLLVASSCKQGSSDESDTPVDNGEVIVDEEENNASAGIPDMELVSNLKIPGQAIDACISGDYVYLTNDLGILYIINVSDRSNPVIEGKCRETESPNIVIVKGDYAYVSYTDIIYENNDYSTKCGFYIIDVSDKTNPELIGNYDTGGNKKKTALGLFVEGGYAYIEIADEEEQEDVSFLEIVDISNKRNPEIFSKYEIEGIATGIWVKDNIALMNVNFYSDDEDSTEGESILVTVDLEDKKNPEIMDDCSVNYNSSSVYSIGDLAFVTSWQLDEEIENYINSKIEVLDIKNPYGIKLVGECEIPGGAWEMDSKDNFIYVSSLSGNLFAVDVKDEKKPYIFDSLDTGGNSYDISIEGEYGYISDGFEGLNIVDLSSDSGEINMNGESEESVDDYYGNYPPEAFIEIYGDIFKENYFQVKNPVYFSAERAMDLDGDELNYVWKIDGNEYSDDEEFRHYFNDPGEYEVELSVSDGKSSSAVSEIVTVAEVNTPVLISKEHNFKVEIEYSLLNKSDTVLNEIECFMGIPQTYYPYQIVNGYSTNYPVEEELFDNDWNSIIHFKFDEEELGKDETISATAEFDITAFEFEIADLDRLSSESMENYDKNSVDYKKYTSDDLFIDSDSPEIREVVEKLTGDIENPLINAAILYNFVVKELSYDFKRAQDSSYEFMYASEILDAGKGVCADYAILYTALLRSAGIPARLSAGIPVYSILHENDKEIELGHAWMDIKFPGYGWLPVDITPEEEFLGPNYYLDIVREKGTGYLYENETMDWERYYFDSFFYSWDSDSSSPDTEQKFEFRVKGINLEDIELDSY